MAMIKFSKSSHMSPPVRKNPLPPIPFIFKVKKMGKIDGLHADKSEWIKLDFLMDPDNSASRYSRQLLSSRMDDLKTGSSG
jgi:hypothetical protein